MATDAWLGKPMTPQPRGRGPATKAIYRSGDVHGAGGRSEPHGAGWYLCEETPDGSWVPMRKITRAGAMRISAGNVKDHEARARRRVQGEHVPVGASEVVGS